MHCGVASCLPIHRRSQYTFSWSSTTSAASLHEAAGVCVLIHVGVVNRQVLHYNRSDNSDRVHFSCLSSARIYIYASRALHQRAASASPLDESAAVCVLIHVGVAPQARTPLQLVLGYPPLAVSVIAGPANTRAGLVLQPAVTVRLVSSEKAVVPVALLHVITVSIQH